MPLSALQVYTSVPLSGAVATHTTLASPFLATVSGVAVRLSITGPLDTCTCALLCTGVPGLPSDTRQETE